MKLACLVGWEQGDLHRLRRCDFRSRDPLLRPYCFVCNVWCEYPLESGPAHSQTIIRMRKMSVSVSPSHLGLQPCSEEIASQASRAGSAEQGGGRGGKGRDGQHYNCTLTVSRPSDDSLFRTLVHVWWIAEMWALSQESLTGCSSTNKKAT